MHANSARKTTQSECLNLLDCFSPTLSFVHISCIEKVVNKQHGIIINLGSVLIKVYEERNTAH